MLARRIVSPVCRRSLTPLVAHPTASVRPPSRSFRSTTPNSRPIRPSATTQQQTPTSENSPLRTYNLFPSTSEASASLQLFRSVGNKSFTIGETRVQGPVIVANGHIFLWDVPQFGVGSPEVEVNDEGTGTVAKDLGDPASPFYGWTEDCLRIFEVMENAPEIIVIGTGAQVHPLPPHLKRYLHSLGMQTEVLASRQAASTYNILVQEGRRPAAALLPPVPTSARTGQVLVKFERGPDRREE